MTSARKAKPKHDHRRSFWAISGGQWLWCYRCGAIKHAQTPGLWTKPTGKNGNNPAV